MSEPSPATRPHAAFGRTLDSLDVAIVDESGYDTAIVRSILTAIRVGRVRHHARPQDAVTALIAEPPQVVLCNWRLQPGDASHFLRVMRSLTATPACFAAMVVLSGRPTLGVIARALRAGAHHVLARPLSPQILDKMLRRLVADPRHMVVDREAACVRVEGAAERLAAIEARRWASLSPARQAAVLARRAARLQTAIDELFAADASDGEPVPEPEGLEVVERLAAPVLSERAFAAIAAGPGAAAVSG